MDKELKQHQQFINVEIAKISDQLAATKKDKQVIFINDEIEKLAAYHNQAIRNFQHERLVHLLVTFFFAILLMVSISTSIALPNLFTAVDGTIMANLLMFINLILIITELFYVKHYYQLENGTQLLYQSSKQLHQLEITLLQNHKNI